MNQIVIQTEPSTDTALLAWDVVIAHQVKRDAEYIAARIEAQSSELYQQLRTGLRMAAPWAYDHVADCCGCRRGELARAVCRVIENHPGGDRHGVRVVKAK